MMDGDCAENSFRTENVKRGERIRKNREINLIKKEE